MRVPDDAIVHHAGQLVHPSTRISGYVRLSSYQWPPFLPYISVNLNFTALPLSTIIKLFYFEQFDSLDLARLGKRNVFRTGDI